MAAKKASDVAIRVALIGLVGTAFTVCGGLAGGGLTAAVKVFQAERERGRVAASAGEEGHNLGVDVASLVVSAQEARELAEGGHRLFPDAGFIMQEPLPGWSDFESLTYRELFEERGSWTGSGWDGEMVWRLRWGDPISVSYTDETLENGVAIDVESLRALYGTDTFRWSTEVTVLAVDRRMAEGRSLPDIAVEWGTLHAGGAHRIVTGEGSDSVLIQSTYVMENVRVGGDRADVSVERWALFAEGPEHVYIVEINYLPQAGESLAVWDDLQTYLDSFRVVD